MSRPADIMQFDDAENPMAMDNIMTALGAEVVPFPLKTECCGAAMGIPRRDITARLTGRILERAQAFGADAALSPGNLVDTRQLELRTPDVTIRVSAERGDLVDTRVIDGVKYILIRADEGVQVNGVNVQIS